LRLHVSQDAVLRHLPQQFGFASGAEFIAALEHAFGLASRAATGEDPAELPRSGRPSRDAMLEDSPEEAVAPDPGALIRAVLNRWLGPVQVLDSSALKRELAERERLGQIISRLHQIGSELMPKTLRKRASNSEIERVATILRRLSLIRSVSADTLVAHCAHRAEADVDFRLHVADPFQLRHLLTFHDDVPHEELNALAIYRLDRAVECRDAATIENWFQETGRKRHFLPKDTPSFLKSRLLQHWSNGRRDLESFAFEQAVLDVRIFGVIGWENTRTFYSLLKRLGGDSSACFDAYLSRDEIDEALAFHRTVRDERQQEHFRHLSARHDPAALLHLEQTIFSAAQERENQTLPPPIDPPAGTRNRRRGLTGLFGLLQPVPSPL